MSDLGHSRNRTRRSRGMDRSPIGKRPPRPRCGLPLAPDLEVDGECLRCAKAAAPPTSPVPERVEEPPEGLVLPHLLPVG